jgi:hypothetical protein
MKDQSPIDQNPDPFDRREARRQRRAERLANPSRGWIAGVILIVIGAILLLQNTGINIPLRNWWSLFILIPAIGALSNALRLYQDADNQLTPAARSSLFGGLVLLLITAMFLFNLSWTLFGPVILILVGLGILLNGMFK